MRKIVITESAKSKITAVLEFISSKYGPLTQKKFVIKLDKAIGVAHKNPEIFPVSIYNKRVRKCVITKQSTVFYAFDDENVVILALFDTRQNPEHIKVIK